MEAGLVEREGIPFIGISAGGLHGVALLNMVRNGWRLIRGTVEVFRHMRREQPSGILTTGGYVSGPVAVVARWLGVPMLVFLPDIEPAQSVKAAGRLATCVATSVEESDQYFPRAWVETTGYPLGTRITKWTRKTGRESAARIWRKQRGTFYKSSSATAHTGNGQNDACDTCQWEIRLGRG